MIGATERMTQGHARYGWRFFGTELKRQRERAGLTQEQLGAAVFCSGSYIGQFETALRKPQFDLAQRIDAALKTDGIFARMCHQLVLRQDPIQSGPFAEYFISVAELEPLAVTLAEYSVLLVPGLLQTADYARAVFQAAQPFWNSTRVEPMVETRIDRAKIFDDPTTPPLWVIIEETVLQRCVGGPYVMAAQFRHIEAAVERSKALVQVMPCSSGAHALMEGSLKLMTFRDAPPLAYIEGPHGGQMLDDPDVVARCMASFDLARATALSPTESLNLLRTVAEEYEQSEPTRSVYRPDRAQAHVQ